MRVERYLPALADQLREAAGRFAPSEGGGIITAHARIVEMANMSVVPAQEYEAAPLHEIEEEYGQVAAVWHTHPEDQPPSARDVSMCAATLLPWIIVGPTRIWVVYPEARPYSGREYVYGEDDCWSLASDWMLQERGVFLPWFERPSEESWEEPGPSPFIECATQFGFTVAPIAEVGFENLQPGDFLIMQIRARKPNHVAVYLGGGTVIYHRVGELSRAGCLDERLQKRVTHVGRYCFK